MANQKEVSGKLTLVENFSGMGFLSSPRVTENDKCLKIDAGTVHPNAIAIFMGLFLLASVSIAYSFFGGKEAVIVFAGGAMAGGMFVGLFYLIDAGDRNRVLPQIDKSRELLILESGTEIPKRTIECFRQYSCKTKMSNFRLALTTVVTKGPSGTNEYAVTPIVGDISEDRIGFALANSLDVRLVQDRRREFSDNELLELGLS